MAVSDISREAGTVTTLGFADWVRPHLPAIARLAARLAPPGEAEDVLQESLARAWEKRRLFDSTRGSPSGWLLAITADRARRAWRRRRPSVLPWAPDRVRAIDDELDVEFAVSRLPARQRLAVDCFYFAGLSIAETAQVLGCAEGTVKSALSDARARLRILLEDRDGR
jgi:RNA polymerase sigma-70 factor (ECF subfamily)